MANKKSINEIYKNLNNITPGGKYIIPRQRKSYFELSTHEKNLLNLKLKKHLRSNIEINQLLLDHGLDIDFIQLIKFDDSPKDLRVSVLNKTKLELDNEKLRLDLNCFEAKDAIYMSDESYIYFRKKTGLNMPSIHYLRKHREFVNEKLPKFEKNKHGLYYQASVRINWILDRKLKKMKIINNKVRICLRGDKTLCGNTSFFNFCFTLPDEGEIAKTVHGQYSLGVFEVASDNYNTMNVALDELSKNMKKFISDNKVITIEWHLAGDMVWMKIERGLNGCNSKYPCFKCELPKDDFYKENYELLSENSPLLRTVQKSEELRISKNNKGYIHKPIFDFIPFVNSHHDPLHEKINIVKILINLVHKKLIAYDEAHYGHSLNLDQLLGQKKLFDWLSSIGVKKACQPKNESSKASDPQFQIRRFLNGTDSLNIAKYMNENVVSVLDEKKNISLLFNNYYRLHQGYTQKYYLKKHELFQERVTEWKRLFNKLFHAKYVTNYIHYFTDHLAYAIEQHGDIDLYNIQGLEKLNDFTTTQYFRGSNRKNYSNQENGYLQQFFQKRARLEFYRINNQEPIESEFKSKKKIKLKKFYLETDLFSISNLSEIDSIVKGFPNYSLANFSDEEEKNEEYNSCSPQDISLGNENGNSVLQIEEDLPENFFNNSNLNDDVKFDSEEYKGIHHKRKIEHTDLIRDEEDNKESINKKSKLSTDEQEAEVYIHYQIDNLMLYKNDVVCCDGKNWLTNTTIYAYMKTYEKNYNILVLDYIQTNKFLIKANGPIGNIIPKKFKGCDVLAGPVFIHDENIGLKHWTLFFVSIKNKQIFYIDPQGTEEKTSLEISKNFIEFAKTVKFFKNIKFENVSLKHQIQKDTYNCGVYVCHFFDLLIKTKEISILNNNIDQNIDINAYRKVILKKISDNSKLTVCCICHRKEQQTKDKNIKNKLISMFSSELKVFKCKHTFHLNCIKSDICIICNI